VRRAVPYVLANTKNARQLVAGAELILELDKSLPAAGQSLEDTGADDVRSSDVQDVHALAAIAGPVQKIKEHFDQIRESKEEFGKATKDSFRQWELYEQMTRAQGEFDNLILAIPKEAAISPKLTIRFGEVMVEWKNTSNVNQSWLAKNRPTKRKPSTTLATQPATGPAANGPRK
jgi:hypothetical protein